MISETYETLAMRIILSIAMLISKFRWLAERVAFFYYLFKQFIYAVLQDFSCMSTVSYWARVPYIVWFFLDIYIYIKYKYYIIFINCSDAFYLLRYYLRL